MKTLPLLAALGLFGFASAAWGFGPASAGAQSHRVFVGPLDTPMVCVPRQRRGDCDRLEVTRGDSDESEQRIARLHDEAQAQRLAQLPRRPGRDGR